MSPRDERRRDFRQRAGLEVTPYSVPGQRLPEGLKFVTINMAVSGMRCASNLPLDDGTGLIATIKLVGGNLVDPVVIKVEGRVVRCAERPKSPANRRYGIAIDFVKMSPEDRKRLTRYVGSL